MTLNHEKIMHHFKLTAMMLRGYRTDVKGELLHCLQGCFRKLIGREDV